MTNKHIQIVSYARTIIRSCNEVFHMYNWNKNVKWEDYILNNVQQRFTSIELEYNL